MRRVWWGLALAGAVVLTLGACSSSDAAELDVGKAKSKIEQLSTNVYSKEAKVGAVKCPDSVPLQKSLTFFCTVEIDGAPLRIRLKQTNAKGNVHIEQADAVIFVSKLVDFVSSYAAQHDRPGTDVDCGKASVLTGPPGDVITCDLTFSDGTSGAAKVRINDADGKVGLISLKRTS